MTYFYYVLLAVISYFIGNITFARVISKINHGDVTKSGSGNPGTLNTWRTFGFWPGVLTFVLDMIKGLVPTLVAYLTFGYLGCDPEIALYIAGFAVVLGHIFPIIFKFKGGKGIATSIGVFFVANWWVALICFALMIVGMIFIKYASIFTIGFVVVMSFIEIFLTSPAQWINYMFISGIMILVVYAHRSNIKKLIQGKENKTELWNMLKGLVSKKKKKEQIVEVKEEK
ncbi:MAG: glycerol-3-phosphate 1-O-acyltransferase PlsY [Clostridia bacterium]|nr:glycerol-3-phosphate 1-O-acyltransferase PlsY [Clostridia bacterium]